MPFEIPDSWEWCKIGTIFSLQAGKNISANQINEYQSDESFPCFGGNGIRGYVSSYNRDGDYPIIGRQGALCGNINLAKGKFYATEHAVCVETFSSTNVLWCCYFLTALNLNQYATATAQPGLAVANINDVFIPLPPLAEQRRIVAKIEELLPYIEKYGKAEENLTVLNTSFPEALKKSILQEAVQGRLVPQDPNDEPASVLLERIRAEKQALVKAGKIKKDKHESVIVTRDKIPYEIIDGKERCIADEVPFEIPEGWEWCRLDSAVLLTTDYVANGSFATLRENVKSYKTPNYALLVKTQDFSNNFTQNLTYTDKAGYDFLSKSVLYGGELMLSNIGASIGKAFIIPNLDIPMTLAPNSIMVKCMSDSMTSFLRYLILSFYGQSLLIGFTEGTAMPKFSKTQLRNALIPIPPLAEQKRIVSKIEELLRFCDKL